MAEVASRDPGLQPQRTALAWARTALATFVNALIVLRAGMLSEHPAVLALGTLLLAACALLVYCGTWRSRQLAQPGVPSAPPSVVMAATVGVTWLACVAGVAAVAVTIS